MLRTGYFAVAGAGGGPSQYLIVGAGGAGGGNHAGGGGGGGEVKAGSLVLEPGISYSVAIGVGGAGGGGVGGNGGNSSFNGIIAGGGGGGGGGGTAGQSAPGGGGGGAGYSTTTGRTPGASTGTAYAGGAGAGSYGSGGGGGGAGVAGADSTYPGPAGKGGDGVQSDITGTMLHYSGGGGGGGWGSSTGGAGGAGGGGAGAVSSGAGAAGTANTGGGGGGSGGDGSGSRIGGKGGDGVVILRHPKDYLMLPTGSLAVEKTIDGDKAVSRITSGSGSITPIIPAIDVNIINLGRATGTGGTSLTTAPLPAPARPGRRRYALCTFHHGRGDNTLVTITNFSINGVNVVGDPDRYFASRYLSAGGAAALVALADNETTVTAQVLNTNAGDSRILEVYMVDCPLDLSLVLSAGADGNATDNGLCSISLPSVAGAPVVTTGSIRGSTYRWSEQTGYREDFIYSPSQAMTFVGSGFGGDGATPISARHQGSFAAQLLAATVVPEVPHAIDISRPDLVKDTLDVTTRTKNGVAFGAPAPDRRIVVCIGGYISGTWNPSVTIGGVPANLLANVNNGSGNGAAAIFMAHVPDGETGTIVINSGARLDYLVMPVYRITGLTSDVPVDTFTSAVASASHTPIVADEGVVIAYAHAGNAAAQEITGLGAGYFHEIAESNYYITGTHRRVRSSAPPTVGFSGGGYWWNRLLVSLG